jgi:hypothetical protein
LLFKIKFMSTACCTLLDGKWNEDILEELKIQPIKFIENYQTNWKQQYVEEWKATENQNRL